MTALPPAPGPEYVFAPPPSWGTPQGIDPRRGHVVVRLGGLFGGGPETGVGSCWEGANGSKSKPVDCSDSSAQFRVVAQTPDPYQCPAASDSYLDSKEDGASRYKCLVPIR